MSVVTIIVNNADLLHLDLTPVLPKADALFMVYALFNALRLTWFMFVPNAFQARTYGKPFIPGWIGIDGVN